MRKFFLPAVIAVSFTVLQACKSADAVFVAPAAESALAHNDRVFVSSLGAKMDPFTPDGDGAIVEFDKKGNVVKKPFNSTKLNAAKGLVVMGDVIYVADIDRAVGFNLSNGEQVSEISFSKEGVKFLNAFAKEDETHFFASDTASGKIFRVSVDGTYKVLQVEALFGPNGLAYDAGSKTLYCGEIGNLQEGKPGRGVVALDLTDSSNIKTKWIYEMSGGYDGLFLHKGKLYVSSWGEGKPETGFILKIDPATGTAEKIREGLSGPADMHYSDGKVYLPEMIKGQASTFSLK